MSATISEAKLVAYLQLIRTEGIGPITFQRLIRLYGDPLEAFDHLQDLSQRGGRKRPLKRASKSAVEKEIATTYKHDGHYLIWGEAGYPPLLEALADAPPILAAYGHRHLLDKPSVAIVGARNASAAAQRITQNLASSLADHDFAIVSGLARGIDGIAHQHSLSGGTIAVIANGIDHYYPPENQDLQEQIRAQGLILCENPPGTKPQASQFPRRNRIIAGLSLGVIVIEAARQSGSLITARLAGEQGREVMAVPGSPLDARCHGSNNLIRDGAYLVETAEDVLEVITPLLDRDTLQARQQPTPLGTPTAPPQITNTDRQRLTDLLGVAPVMVDELVEYSNLPLSAVHLILLELELAGRLLQEPGGQISLMD